MLRDVRRGPQCCRSLSGKHCSLPSVADAVRAPPLSLPFIFSVHTASLPTASICISFPKRFSLLLEPSFLLARKAEVLGSLHVLGVALNQWPEGVGVSVPQRPGPLCEKTPRYVFHASSKSPSVGCTASHTVVDE